MTYTVSSGTLNPSIPYHCYSVNQVNMIIGVFTFHCRIRCLRYDVKWNMALVRSDLVLHSTFDEVKLLGVYLTNTFVSTAHVNHLLTIGNQRLFLLSQLKSQGLALDSLHIVFQAIIQSKLTYAFPAFAGQLTAMDITHFDALARKAKRRGPAN